MNFLKETRNFSSLRKNPSCRDDAMFGWEWRYETLPFVLDKYVLCGAKVVGGAFDGKFWHILYKNKHYLFEIVCSATNYKIKLPSVTIWRTSGGTPWFKTLSKTDVGGTIGFKPTAQFTCWGDVAEYHNQCHYKKICRAIKRVENILKEEENATL